jgi:hypothetical protein
MGKIEIYFVGNTYTIKGDEIKSWKLVGSTGVYISRVDGNTEEIHNAPFRVYNLHHLKKKDEKKKEKTRVLQKKPFKRP